MKKTFLCYFLLCVTMLTLSCGDQDYDECAFQPKIEVVQLEIEQLEDILLDINDRDSLRAFIKGHPIITEFFLKRGTYPNDSIMMDVLLKKFSNPYIDSLQFEIDRVFGDLTTLKSELSMAFSHLRYYYPDAKLPKVQTIATGLDFDLYVSDTLIVIGLDDYMGEGAKFRPLGLYNYILTRYSPAHIVPSIMLLYGISPNYNATELKDKTLLADMIAYGKSFYFAKQMMPCTPDRIFIWYTPEEMTGVRENIDIIWTHFVENELLFESNHMVKNKYIEDRPKTYEIGEKAPGRIGTWLGWEIVKKYMEENDDVTLPELMKIESPQKLFKDSKFKPGKKGLF
jgi:hypothetical protein